MSNKIGTVFCSKASKFLPFSKDMLSTAPHAVTFCLTFVSGPHSVAPLLYLRLCLLLQHSISHLGHGV